MGAERKREVPDLVRRSPLSKARTLEELGIPRSTYYRWHRRFRQQGELGLVDRRLKPQDEETILKEALRQPQLSGRELAYCANLFFGYAPNGRYRRARH